MSVIEHEYNIIFRENGFLSTYNPKTAPLRDTACYVVIRPGVAGAVLQTPSSIIHSFID